MPTQEVPPWQEPKTNPTSTCQGYIHRETERATYFEVVQVNNKPVQEPKTVWFPLSRTKSITKAAAGSNDFDNITVEDWLLERNGLK